MSVIAILGPGGVGGFLAAALARPSSGEDVLVVAREETAAAIARDGIALDSVLLGSFLARPRVAASLREPAGVLLVATKASGLEAALERIEAEPGLVVPLLNGLEHMTPLRERFGAGAVAAGSIRIESDRRGPGVVVQTSPTVRVELSGERLARLAELERLASVLVDAGVPARILPSEAQVLWSKLVRLNALACTTSAADRPVGFIRSDPGWRHALVGCIEETAAVACAEGAEIDPAALLAELDEAHAELGSSMQRDVAAGRTPELDAIAGAVLRAGARHGLRCPTVEALSARIAARAGIPPPAGRV
jgi:2-dehydropantoate 2-reductase